MVSDPIIEKLSKPYLPQKASTFMVNSCKCGPLCLLMMQVYVEDALGDRVWVDLDPCKELIANICTLFATKPHSPASAAGGGGVAGGGAGGKAGEQGKGSEGSEGSTGEVSEEGLLSGVETAPRYVFESG